MTTSLKYWFPAKRYGWGWGLPVVWQGWAVLGCYAIIAVFIAFAVPPDTHPMAFIAALGLLSIMLTIVCWIKGEPPRWRWGK